MSGKTQRFSQLKNETRIDSAPSFNPTSNTQHLTPSPLAWLANHALVGAAAAWLLAVVEWIDMQIQLTPVFASPAERLTLTAYFSMNVLMGAVIGLLVGIVALALTFLRRIYERVIEAIFKGRLAAWMRYAIAGLGAAATVTIILKQHLRIHAYLIGIIREAEKFAAIRNTLLNHERATSYIILMGLVTGCALVWMISVRAGRMRRGLRALWVAALVAVSAAAYYIDSRIEVTQYDPTMHRSMFLLNTALAMALVATAYSSSARLRDFWKTGNVRLKRGFAVALAAVIGAALIFTFLRFDENHNLKTQIFYRTAQAEQHFRFANYLLDWDRDSYAAVLGGGDSDDRRFDINPGAPEIPEDGIDNNGIGGDLSHADIKAWQEEILATRQPNPDAARFNVIFFFIDTLRADHLGTYGYPRPTSPNLDRLAARSTVFENGFSPAPNTYEAYPKFMQSSYWDGHYPTWSELLTANGYNSLLFPRRITTTLRFVKGMQVVKEAHVSRWHETVDKAIEVLAKQPTDRPFSAFLYATDPHRPYRKHEQFDFGSSMIDRYDGEIAYVDYHFGRLLDWLEESGRLQNTVIAIMADHGESLGERGVYKHSGNLYNEQIRVPFIIHVPNQQPRRVSDYVSTIDLGATILDAVGIELPKEYAGISLMPLIRGQQMVRPPVYGEQTTKQDSPFVKPHQNVHPESKKYMVITQDGFKLIYNRNQHTFELFDLKNDPREERNLYNAMPERAAAMKRLLGRYIDILTYSRPWDADESKYFFHDNREQEDENEM